MSQRPLYPHDHRWHPLGLAPDYKTSITRAPQYPKLSLDQTASELTGPTFRTEDIAEIDRDLLRNHVASGDPIRERIIIHGCVLDENGRPVPQTLVEIWQADAAGR
ncbi:dioxygenase family protein [Roseobacter weihaiensis]|uniref:dioxygenase family protein n=1 Tax=Roseobacter weihaiensis TaxID=2763262 RepID=UPI001D0B9D3A|nr:hypothetical protein [Roseobacter sp. H9]